MTDLEQLAEAIHADAHRRGKYDAGNSIPTCLDAIRDELAEAREAWREIWRKYPASDDTSHILEEVCDVTITALSVLVEVWPETWHDALLAKVAHNRTRED